jgi:hypothetical protein
MIDPKRDAEAATAPARSAAAIIRTVLLPIVALLILRVQDIPDKNLLVWRYLVKFFLDPRPWLK